MLEADPKERYKGLRLIGIDETSYRKGHSYITVVVNHETNTVVWAHKGHGKEVLDLFFKELTREQRESIEVVTGDGARWITDCISEHCPNAKRCVDPFHVVEWANAALDEVRREAWRRALDKVQRIEARIGKEKDEKRKAKLKDKLSRAKDSAEQIKNSRYAVGKNPEHLTARQRTKLELIQAEDGPLARAHAMKEQLRIIFRETDADEAEKSLDAWITRRRGAGSSRSSSFSARSRGTRNTSSTRSGSRPATRGSRRRTTRSNCSSASPTDSATSTA
jgi:Transposase and inactivated derivatives